MLLLGRREGNPLAATVFRPAGGRKTGLKCLLAHIRSLRDNYVYRASFTRRNRRLNSIQEILHDHRRRH